jgi:hypothetical protein
MGKTEMKDKRGKKEGMKEGRRPRETGSISN